MPIQNLPASLVNVLEQQNFLDSEIRPALENTLTFYAAAEREPVPARRGESIRRSRHGLKPPQTKRANPATIGDLDNGMTPSQLVYEQYQVGIDKWHDTMDLDLETDETLIADQFVAHHQENARQAATSLDILSAQEFYTAYDSGNTFVLGETDTQHVQVDNIANFDTAFSAASYPAGFNPLISPGLPATTTAGNPLLARVFSSASPPVLKGTVSIVGTLSDAPANTSIAGVNGQSGTLVLSAVPGFAIAAGDQIVAIDGAVVIRPNKRNTAKGLVSGDTISLSHFAQAKARLVARGVKPMRNGLYGAIVDPIVMAQLTDDPRFVTATQGSFDRSPVFQRGIIAKAMGLEFVEGSTIPAYLSPDGLGLLRHAAVLGEGALVKAPFEGSLKAAKREQNGLSISDIRLVNDVKFTTRPAMDREGNFVAQTWSYTGGFVAPTDITSNPKTMPTSDWSRYKRGVSIQVYSDN